VTVFTPGCAMGGGGGGGGPRGGAPPPPPSAAVFTVTLNDCPGIISCGTMTWISFPLYEMFIFCPGRTPAGILTVSITAFPAGAPPAVFGALRGTLNCTVPPGGHPTGTAILMRRPSGRSTGKYMPPEMPGGHLARSIMKGEGGAEARFAAACCSIAASEALCFRSASASACAVWYSMYCAIAERMSQFAASRARLAEALSIPSISESVSICPARTLSDPSSTPSVRGSRRW